MQILYNSALQLCTYKFWFITQDLYKSTLKFLVVMLQNARKVYKYEYFSSTSTILTYLQALYEFIFVFPGIWQKDFQLQ